MEATARGSPLCFLGHGRLSVYPSSVAQHKKPRTTFANPKSLAVLTSIISYSLQGCSMLAALGPTPTPTPSPTQTASPTPTTTSTTTPSPSPSPTQTKTPTPLPAITKKRLSDKFTLVTDNEIGYQLTIPAGWTVIDMEPEELGDILSGYQKIAPEEGLSTDKVDEIANAFRFMAIDLAPEHMLEGFPSHIFMTVEESLAEDMPVEFLLEWRVSILKKDPEKRYLGHRLLHGINDHSAGWIDNQMIFPTLYGEELQSHLAIILIPDESYTLILFMGCEKSLYPELRPIFETILYSLEFED